jgi:hypothetical protein
MYSRFKTPPPWKAASRKALVAITPLEGTDVRVARKGGGLKANSFIRPRTFFREGQPVLDIDELYLRETA